MYVTLSGAKQHLNIDCNCTCDDEYIFQLIQVAEDAVERTLNVKLSDIVVGGELPPSILSAILLLIGNLYANREPVTSVSVNEVPYTFRYLLSLYRNYVNLV